MKIKKLTEFTLNEKLDLTKINNNFSDEYIDLKTDLIDIINNILEENSDVSVKNDDLLRFINDYIDDGRNSTKINSLIDDNDIFNFYLKHQSDIDELLNNTEYLDQTPKNNNVYSLYDVVIDGTKQSIIEILKIIKKEIK
jgi:hypothetical protein